MLVARFHRSSTTQHKNHRFRKPLKWKSALSLSQGLTVYTRPLGGYELRKVRHDWRPDHRIVSLQTINCDQLSGQTHILSDAPFRRGAHFRASAHFQFIISKWSCPPILMSFGIRIPTMLSLQQPSARHCVRLRREGLGTCGEFLSFLPGESLLTIGFIPGVMSS